MDSTNLTKVQWLLSLLIFLLVTLLTIGIAVALKASNLLDFTDFRLMASLSAALQLIGIAVVYKYLSITLFSFDRLMNKVLLVFLGVISYLICDVLLSFLNGYDFFWSYWNYGLSDFWWILIIFLAALGEELIFRKYLLDFFKGLGTHVVIAVLVASVVFALTHIGGFENPLPLIVSGVVYCIVTIVTRSVAYAVGAHFAFNLFAGIEDVSSIDHSQIGVEGSLDSVYLDVSLLVLFFTGLGVYRSYKYLNNEKNRNHPA